MCVWVCASICHTKFIFSFVFSYSFSLNKKCTARISLNNLKPAVLSLVTLLHAITSSYGVPTNDCTGNQQALCKAVYCKQGTVSKYVQQQVLWAPTVNVLFFALHFSISTTRLGKTSSDALWQKSVSHDMIGWLTNKQKHDYICIAYFTLCNYDQALCTFSNNYKLLLVVVIVVTFLQGPEIHTKKSLFFYIFTLLYRCYIFCTL